ncbi:MAG: 1-deoxy-D-xylulose-5-phosphate reductoisomerase [Patescibacteria group bacterium]
MKNIVILGSTGSVGTQTLEVIDRHRDVFNVYGLACGSNVDLLSKQVAKYKVAHTAVADPKEAMALVRDPAVDLVVFAMSHTADALSIFRTALESGAQIAMATKEVVIEYGPAVAEFVIGKGSQASEAQTSATYTRCRQVIPLDSEMSATFQILQNAPARTIKTLYLPCTGGPFYGRTRDELQSVTVEQALTHPRWKMGRKISIDSATLMNKAFEIIEAAYLFDLKPAQIKVFIEPEARIHSVVEFDDGSFVTHRDEPDMRRPIEYALLYPNGVASFAACLSYEKPVMPEPDYGVFPSPLLAYRALGASISPRTLITEDSRAVQNFLDGKISFLEIYKTIMRNLQET